MKKRHGAGNDTGGERNFMGVLEEYDRQMGRLLDGLRQSGLATNTLVLFTGDNGPLPTYKQRRTAGLRGSKLSLYEGGIREPFLVWWPGRAPAGMVNERTVLTATDLLPSICRAAGASLPNDIVSQIDGEDLSAAFVGATPMRTKPVLWEYGRNNISFAYPKPVRDRSPNLAIREAEWKLLINADGSGAELFNVVADPMEEQNLVAQKPDIGKRLSEMVLKWKKSLP